MLLQCMYGHISAAHIPGVHNVLADKASRNFEDASEWMPSTSVVLFLTGVHGIPEIDLFASRLNKQLPVYTSWLPDPESTHIDAMSISWSDKYVYLFPPFSLLWPVLTKMEEDQLEMALIIVPYWPTQSWFPKIMEMRNFRSSAALPGTTDTHPL